MEHKFTALTKEDVSKIIAATDGKEPYPVVFALYQNYRGQPSFWGGRKNQKTAQWLCEALVVAWSRF